jgi:hypothetical protein
MTADTCRRSSWSAAIAIALFVAVDVARAQTPDTRAAAPADNHAWSFSASAYTYVLSDNQYYVQPTISAGRGRLHLEARYNYENLDTGSAWLGANFSGGKTLEWELTPMLGGVFGETTGIAPGLQLSLSWWKLNLSSENEYVFDAGDSSDSFFYNWSELTLTPAGTFQFGLVTQRTRVYQTDREIQRGVMAGFSIDRVTVSGYVFNPDEDKPKFVFAVAMTF